MSPSRPLGASRPHALFCLLVLSAVWALAAAPADAQGLTGTWTITSEGRAGPVTRTLVLTQSGNTLTGTITLPAFGRGGGAGGAAGGLPQTVPIAEGSVNGNAFSFTTTVEFQGNSFTQRFSGTFQGNSMQGQIEGGRGGAQPFTGTRS
jgi:hypothetical protein